MQSSLRVLSVFLVVFVASCGDESSSQPRASFVTADGTVVSFPESWQTYDALADETKIDLGGSTSRPTTPPGWRVEIFWPGDTGPASVETALGEMVIFVDSPGRVLLTADDTTAQAVTAGLTSFAFQMGGRTEGFFGGGVEGRTDPTDMMILEDGWFRVTRRN